MEMERGVLVLLSVQAAAVYWRLYEKPPVTTALIAVMGLVHFRPTFLHEFLPTLDQIFFNPNLIIMNKDLKRFFLSAFYHIGEAHIIHNMVSLLWTGIELEDEMGSLEYAFMVAVLLCMSHGIVLLLAKILLLFNHERAYYVGFSAGFSAVLFAMKVILYSHSYYVDIYRITVPASYAAWVDLLVVQILVPDVSLLGHLGGVLAGILYSYLKYLCSGPDAYIPGISLRANIGGVLAVLLYLYLKSYSAPNQPVQMIRGLGKKLCCPLRSLARKFQSSRKRYFGGGIVGRRQASNSSVVWRCRVCTYDNLRLGSKCEMCETERGVNNQLGTGYENLPESTQTERGGNDESGAVSESLSVEELRRRRLERFTRRRRR